MSEFISGAKVEKYVKDGKHCPRCNSSNVVPVDGIQHESATEATHAISCSDCGLWWEDVYVLQGISYPHPKKDDESITILRHMQKLKLPYIEQAEPFQEKPSYKCPIIHTEFVAITQEDEYAHLGVPTMSKAGIRVTYLRPTFSSSVGAEERARIASKVLSYEEWLALPQMEFEFEIPRI